MKAIFKNPNATNARQPDNKEMVDTLNVIGKKDGKLHNFVTARFYMGRSASASVVYCCLWVHGAGVYVSGKGQAGGYGYHKESAALADAIRSAEIELYGDQYEKDNSRARNKKPTHISGCGESAMEGALRAIAKAAGARGELLVITN